MTVLCNARVVTPDGVLPDGCVTVQGERIADVRPGRPDTADRPLVDLAGAWLVPGFIDLHMHGGGGHSVTASPDDLHAAVQFHLRHGTTRTLVSLVTASLDALERQLGWIADLAADPATTVLGAHLEGPFLSPARRGAQNAAHLRPPDRAALAGLVDAAAGTLRSVTLAPELPGALDLIPDVLAAGVVAAIGHSDATYTQACAAIDAGATLATHLFNGMRPLHHREPGIVGAALGAGLACELINDGVHVHPAIIGLLARQPDRLVFVTDAIEAAGVGDGRFELGGQTVQVRDGEARLDDGSLAGSTLTMDAALRRAVVECGVPIEVAATCAAANAARVLGVADRCGAISAGLDADLVVLDEALHVQRVMTRGVWAVP
jgi:N-acetylglucosamine-6-phosphate deacetylase